jgi:hypothetical protein
VALNPQFVAFVGEQALVDRNIARLVVKVMEDIRSHVTFSVCRIVLLGPPPFFDKVAAQESRNFFWGVSEMIVPVVLPAAFPSCYNPHRRRLLNLGLKGQQEVQIIIRGDRAGVREHEAGAEDSNKPEGGPDQH